MKTWQIGALVAAALALFLFTRRRGGTVAAAITSLIPGAFPVASTAPPTSPYEPAVTGTRSVPTSALPPVSGPRTAYRPPAYVAPSVGPAVETRKGVGHF